MRDELISVMGTDSPPLRTDPRRRRCEQHNRDLYPEEVCSDCFSVRLEIESKRSMIKSVMKGMQVRALRDLLEEAKEQKSWVVADIEQEIEHRKTLVTTRKNRSTGTYVTVGSSENIDMAHDPELLWWTVCDDHGSLVGHRTKKLATEWSSAPEMWCEEWGKLVKK